MPKKIIVRDKESNNLMIQTDDLRACEYVFNYIISKLGAGDYYLEKYFSYTEMMTPLNYCEQFKKYFKILGDKKTDEILPQIDQAYHFEFIPISYFSWIKKSKSACMWHWINIRLHQDETYCDFPLYEKFELTRYPISHEERFDLIVQYFDKYSQLVRYSRWEKSRNAFEEKQIENDKEDKSIRNNTNKKLYSKPITRESLTYYTVKDYFEDLKLDWLDLYNQKDMLDWVDIKDEKQCRWVWDFLQKEHISKRKKDNPECRAPIRLNSNDFFEFFKFSNNEERYLGIYGAINYTASSYKKIKLLQLMKKTWLQKIARAEKKKTKKIPVKSKKKETQHILSEVPDNQSDPVLEIKKKTVTSLTTLTDSKTLRIETKKPRT